MNFLWTSRSSRNASVSFCNCAAIVESPPWEASLRRSSYSAKKFCRRARVEDEETRFVCKACRRKGGVTAASIVGQDQGRREVYIAHWSVCMM